MVLAKHYSRKAVIEAAKQAGIRWRELSHAEITAQALAYCEANREAMIAKALRVIEQSPTLMKLAEQERRRRAKLNTGAQKPKARTTGLSAVHMSCAKGGNE
jgi:hypothetical protein